LTSSESLHQKISQALLGHIQAIDLFVLIRDVLHFWDDLIDKDKAVPDADINQSMFKALVAIPGNSFYREHQDKLLPVLTNAIANWHTANQFEQTADRDRLEQAFVIRSDYANVLIQMAYLVGGYDWMIQVTPMIRAMWTTENFSAYLSNLQRERAAKRGMATDLVQSWYEQETPEYLKHGLTVFNAAMMGATEREHVDKLISFIKPPSGATVVDMGCGVGGISRLMKESDPTSTCYGVTNVQAQVDVMRQLGGVEPVLCDYHHVPLDDAVADVVLFSESIGYGDLIGLLKESYRLLKPSGVVVIKDVAGLTGKPVWSTVWQWMVHPKGEIDQVAKELGFTVPASETYACDMTRYEKFLNESPMMHDRYGVLDVPAGEVEPWIWLLQKPENQNA